MSLRFHVGLGLAGDRVRLRGGWDGTEPVQVARRYARLQAGTRRFALAINTWYPEIAGGYYLNGAIIVRVQDVLRSLGIYLVADEYFDPAHVLPAESAGGLVQGENYVLADADQSVGSVQLWAFDGGGGDPFYRDALVMDFAVFGEASGSIKDALAKGLRAAEIAVEEWPDVSSRD